MGALLLMYLAMSAAAAQTWLAATDPGRSDLGPDIAKGAVIWSHGRALTAEDWQSPTPAYVAALRKGGWDTFRFNRWREGDTLPASADALVGYVRELKARGYAQVVLAGQSYGAFLSLMAAAADSDDIAAVVATAPAAFGSFSDSYDTWRRNASALYPLLESVRSRVMMFYFHGDDYDPGGRGNRSEEILAARQVEHLVIDQPADLTGHWASTSPRFVERFGRCILGFIDGDAGELGPSCGTGSVRVADRPLPVTRKSGGASAR
jgi:pimeloyl-ACP methyl ester carboxylesterase